MQKRRQSLCTRYRELDMWRGSNSTLQEIPPVTWSQAHLHLTAQAALFHHHLSLPLPALDQSSPAGDGSSVCTNISLPTVRTYQMSETSLWRLSCVTAQYLRLAPKLTGGWSFCSFLFHSCLMLECGASIHQLCQAQGNWG